MPEHIASFIRTWVAPAPLAPKPKNAYPAPWKPAHDKEEVPF